MTDHIECEDESKELDLRPRTKRKPEMQLQQTHEALTHEQLMLTCEIDYYARNGADHGDYTAPITQLLRQSMEDLKGDEMGFRFTSTVELANEIMTRLRREGQDMRILQTVRTCLEVLPELEGGAMLLGQISFDMGVVDHDVRSLCEQLTAVCLNKARAGVLPGKQTDRKEEEDEKGSAVSASVHHTTVTHKPAQLDVYGTTATAGVVCHDVVAAEETDASAMEDVDA